MFTTEETPGLNNPFCNVSYNAQFVSVGVTSTSRKSSGRTTHHCNISGSELFICELAKNSTLETVSANGGRSFARAFRVSDSGSDLCGSPPLGLCTPADASNTKRVGRLFTFLAAKRSAIASLTESSVCSTILVSVNSLSIACIVSAAFHTSFTVSVTRNRGSPTIPSFVILWPRQDTIASHPFIALAKASIDIRETSATIGVSRGVSLLSVFEDSSLI